MNNNELKVKMRNYSSEVVGPVMLRYTEWILSQAQERGIKKIYFLARDGYLLCEIAKRVAKKRNIDIECKYFYCSRQALRMPSYHIIGEEAYNLLLLGGYHITPNSLLSRACFSEEEKNELYKQLDIKNDNCRLAKSEFEALCDKIKMNEFYRKTLLKKSREAYSDTIEYLKQEGMFDSDTVAIADSGWTGSMQRSLRQLLRNEGYQGNIIGFYFGMYKEPVEEADGEYLNFYFTAKKGVKRKAYFCNNLFECMLSAPHAMTIGYKQTNSGIVPILTDDISPALRELTVTQIDGAIAYTENYLNEEPAILPYKKAVKQVFQILKKAMLTPSREFVMVYGSFTFCDDVTEGYHMTLADAEKKNLLSNYMLIPRIFYKLFGRKSAKEELFWPYGVVAFCPTILRPWYRLNIIGWELLKAFLKKQ